MTKINKITTIADTEYLKLYNAEYTNKNGRIKNWAMVSRKNLDAIENKFFKGADDTIDAVVIVANHIHEDKLAIIKQFRVPINDYIYELPAGLVDDGEDFESTVKRELKEETGLDLVEIDYNKTKSNVYVSTGMTDECIALVFCSCSGNISKDYLEEDEDIEAILLSKKEAEELIKSNKSIDIKALMAIQNYVKESL